MKVIHIESGLGNQMLSFCEYLAMKQMNPQDEVFIENIIYDIPECNDIICQWNGYELERIFGVKVPNVMSLFNDEQWKRVMDDLYKTKFWERNWNWPVYISHALRQGGVSLKNIRGDFEEKGHLHISYDRNRQKVFKDYFRGLDIYKYLKMKKDNRKYRRTVPNTNYESKVFIQSDENLFTGQQLCMKFKNSGIELIEKEIRKIFQFPEIVDDNNKRGMALIKNTDSVAIHARRGDMLGHNYNCYRFGYFKRAVKYIRMHVENPEFFIFCDPGSVEWAKTHESIFGLDFKKDKIHFVDWNKDLDSYRDMQLMAQCKHQIITKSSFGWWGAWLNENPNKITCSPDFRINTTHTF